VALGLGVRFLSPSGLPVILGYFGVAEQVGCIGRFTGSAGGALVGRGSPTVRSATALDLLFALARVIARHPRKATAEAPRSYSPDVLPNVVAASAW
jgi:hypothetical protein